MHEHHHEHHEHRHYDQGACCESEHHHEHHHDEQGCCCEGEHYHAQEHCCEGEHHEHHHHDEEMASAPLSLADCLAEAWNVGAWDFEDDTTYVEPPFTTFAFQHEGATWQVSQWGNSADMPLVLLHGFMQTSATWKFVAPELAQQRCVYALDFVGHGSSDKPHDAAPYAYDAAVGAVGAFLEEVACVHPETHATRKAHLMGYSMGGRVAVQVALQNPQKVYSVILESCGLGPADVEERALAEQRNADWASKLRRDGIEEFVALWEELPLFATQKQRNLTEKLRAERLANDPEAMALCLEGMGKHAMPLEADTVGSLAITYLPVKYLWGSKDTTCQRPAHQLSHEGFDVTAFDVGHNVHLEAPMAYLESVKQFLNSIELKGLH